MGAASAAPFLDHDLVLAKFPYIVVFRLAEPVVYVVAIAHGKREPNYWFGR